jgi:peptidoglycan/LPS O-acetylase OafA/YrhL
MRQRVAITLQNKNAISPQAFIPHASGSPLPALIAKTCDRIVARREEISDVYRLNRLNRPLSPGVTLVAQSYPNSYRADIDGLRGLAVIAVICFHAFPSVVPGGFVGVDVFFVISGYLISAIIFENIDRGTFSFLQFYYRRIRRIFPALITVLIGCFIIGWWYLLPEEFKQLGTHIANGGLFTSNFRFWHEAGYFDKAADTKPLLHLWSLAVEEQFYITWPFLLWVARKVRSTKHALMLELHFLT